MVVVGNLALVGTLVGASSPVEDLVGTLVGALAGSLAGAPSVGSLVCYSLVGGALWIKQKKGMSMRSFAFYNLRQICQISSLSMQEPALGPFIVPFEEMLGLLDTKRVDIPWGEL